MAAAIKQLAATARDASGKGAARSVRRTGRVPGVIYGGGHPPRPISMDFKTVNTLIYAGHFLTTIFEIEVGGVKERAIPRDYQLDVVKDRPMHIDFLRLTPGSTLRVEIPVHFLNQETCPGIKVGGTLNIVHHTIEMRVPADAIPDAVTIDLAGVNINESIHLSSIKLPEGCRPIMREKDMTIATITPPTTYKEEAAPQAAAAAAAPAAAAGAKAPAAAAAPAAKK